MPYVSLNSRQGHQLIFISKSMRDLLPFTDLTTREMLFSFTVFFYSDVCQICDKMSLFTICHNWQGTGQQICAGLTTQTAWNADRLLHLRTGWDRSINQNQVGNSQEMSRPANTSPLFSVLRAPVCIVCCPWLLTGSLQVQFNIKF